MDVIDLEDEEIDAEVLNSMAVTQVCWGGGGQGCSCCKHSLAQHKHPAPRVC